MAMSSKRKVLDAGDDTIDWDLAVAKGKAEMMKMNRGVCPACEGAGLTRQIDPRQNGEKCGLEGDWVNYRCPCGFARDVVEAEQGPSAAN